MHVKQMENLWRQRRGNESRCSLLFEMEAIRYKAGYEGAPKEQTNEYRPYYLKALHSTSNMKHQPSVNELKDRTGVSMIIFPSCLSHLQQKAFRRGNRPIPSLPPINFWVSLNPRFLECIVRHHRNVLTQSCPNSHDFTKWGPRTDMGAVWIQVNTNILWNVQKLLYCHLYREQGRYHLLQNSIHWLK